MKIIVIHGQAHKGITYTMTHRLLDKLTNDKDEIREFFLPKDGPNFCYGCNSCFLKGEEYCPSAEKVQPIAKSIEWADVIILDSPNYVMEMSGALKNLMDHFAYMWVTHRPHGSMFKKVGVVICSSAGAPTKWVLKSMAKQLKWMCVQKVYSLGLTSNALGVANLKESKQSEMEKKADRIAKTVKNRVDNPHISLRGWMMFNIFRKMQLSEEAGWNPTDRDWWKNQGWIADIRPWKGN